MRLSDKAIKDFQDIYYKKFGKRLSDEEANKYAVEWLELFKLVYEPLPKEKKKNG